MTRLSMRGMRDNINAANIGTGGLAADQCLKRAILESAYAATSNPAFAQVLNRQEKLISGNKVAKRYADDRRKPRKKTDCPRRKRYMTPEGVNECRADVGRSYSSKVAELMEKKQVGFPNVMRHCTTIHMMVIPLNGNAQISTDLCRPIMRKAFSQFSDGAQVDGMFQIAWMTAAEIAAILPPDELPACLDPINRPDEVFGLLHWHGIIADPYLTRNMVGKIIRRTFSGCRRVHVQKVIPERVNKYGEITHGAQGYLEYTALSKTEVKFRTYHQKKAAVLGFALLDATWNKRNRRFSMGKSLAVTGVKIDPARVTELEVMERLNHVKGNWEKLCCAERFIHLWFSNMISIIKKPQTWLEHGTSMRDRFLQTLILIKNWSTDGEAQDIDFLDYVEVPLE
jgi:hypothetical protein